MSITVRPGIKNLIGSTLDNTQFSRHMFEVKIQAGDELISVTYLAEPHYSFIVTNGVDPKNVRNKFRCVQTPGSWSLESEESFMEQFTHFPGQLSGWCARIYEDYKAVNPLCDEIDKMREEFNRSFSEHSKDSGVHFSEDEKEKLLTSINLLAAKIEKLYEEKDETRGLVNVLKAEVNKLKDNLRVLDKRTWRLDTVNKIFDLFAKAKIAKKKFLELTGDVSYLLDKPESSDEEGTDS